MLNNYYYYAYVGYHNYNFTYGAGVQYTRGRFKVSLVEKSLKRHYDNIVIINVLRITKSEYERLLKEENE